MCWRNNGFVFLQPFEDEFFGLINKDRGSLMSALAVGVGVIQVIFESMLDVLRSFDDRGAKVFITLGYYESVIIPEQLESSCLVKEQVAGSSMFDKHGLEAKVECFKALCDRPGHGIEFSGGSQPVDWYILGL